MTPSLDNLYALFHSVPEEPQPQNPLPRAELPHSEALARIAVALFHWKTTAIETEAKLESLGDRDAVAQMRIVQGEIADSLDEAGIEIVDPMGKTFDEVIETVSVVAWRQQAGAAGETVCQVLEPVIKHRGAIVRQGKVVMLQPPRKEPEPVVCNSETENTQILK